MNCIAAIEKMQEGAFVTCKGLASNESIHFYKGKYYLEDGTIVSINWIGERRDFDVIANPEKVNITLLKNLHEYYNEHTCSYGTCKLNYQTCIEEKYACYGGPVNNNVSPNSEQNIENKVENSGRGEFANPFNRVDYNKNLKELTITTVKKEKTESRESNNYSKKIPKDYTTIVFWVKFFIGAIALILVCGWLGWLKIENRGFFDDNTLDMTLDNAEDMIKGKDNSIFNYNVKCCKDVIDKVAIQEGTYISEFKSGIESLSGYDETTGENVIVVKEIRCYNNGIISEYQWQFRYKEDLEDDGYYYVSPLQ